VQWKDCCGSIIVIRVLRLGVRMSVSETRDNIILHKNNVWIRQIFAGHLIVYIYALLSMPVQYIRRIGTQYFSVACSRITYIIDMRCYVRFPNWNGYNVVWLGYALLFVFIFILYYVFYEMVRRVACSARCVVRVGNTPGFLQLASFCFHSQNCSPKSSVDCNRCDEIMT